MRVEHNADTPLIRNGGQAFLHTSTLSLACLLLASGAICWIAANWAHASVFQKLFGTQAALTLLVLLAWRLAAVSETDQSRPFSVSAQLISLAAVTTGALLALIGQTYQTGADPWELFLLWAVLLIPWLLTLRTVVLALLCALLLNVAAVLYLDMSAGLWWFGFLSEWAEVGLLLVLLNLILLILWEYGVERLNDRWRIGPRALGAAALAWLLAAGIATPESDIWVFTIPSVIALVLMAGFYTRKRPDLPLVCLAALTAFSLITILLINWLEDDGLWLTIVLLIGLAGWGLRRLSALVHAKQPTVLQEPWFLSLLRLAVMMITASLTVFLTFLMLDLDTGALWIAGLIIGAGGLWLSRACRSGILYELGMTLMLAGLLLIGIDLFFMDDIDPGLRAAAMVLIGTLLYTFASSVALRFLCVVLVLGSALVLTWPMQNQYGLLDVFDPNASWINIPLLLRLWCLAVAAVLTLTLGARSRHPAFWAPLAWGLVCLTQLIAWIAPAPTVFELVDSPAPALIIIWLACAVLPVVVLAGVLWRQQRMSNTLRMGAPIVLAIASLGWMGAPGIALALAWVILGYELAQRGLLVFGVLALLSYLARFYYLLDSSLLQKSWVLCLTGAWLLLAWFGLRHMLRRAARPPHNTPTPKAQPVRRPWREAGLVTGLVLVLLVANTGIYQREQILATGQRLVLALAPVDPRSLIQGDYMALNFAVATQLPSALEKAPAALAEQIEAQQGGYLILQPDAQGVHQLAGISAQIDDPALKASPDALALEFRLRKQGARIVTNAWFFPEGQASSFERARYGEIRVDSTGQGLLTHMLDAQHQVLGE